MSNLETLILGDNPLRDSGVQALCAGLNGLQKIKVLDLHRVGATHACCPALVSLLENTEIRELDLSWNNLGAKGAKALEIALRFS